MVQQFQFLGFSFSVIKGLFAAISIALLAPSIFFSLKILKLNRSMSKLKGEDRSETEQEKSLKKAEALLAHGRFDAIPEQLADVPADKSALLNAKAYIASGQWEMAVDLLKKSYQQAPDPEQGYLLAETLIANGEPAIEVLDRLIQTDPDIASKAYGMLLNQYDKAERWMDCVDLIKDMEQRGLESPTELLPAYRYEWVHSQFEGTTKKKIEHYQQILKQAPNFVPANLGLGDTYMDSGAVEKAFRVYEQAFELTRNPVFLNRLENYYLEQDRPEDAIQIYRQLLVKLDLPFIHFKLGKLYYKLEMLDEALEVLEPLKGQMKGITGYMYCLADIKARRSLYREALEDFKRLVKTREETDEDCLCTHCETEYRGWVPRCDHCRQWDTVKLRAALIKEQQVSQSPLYY